MAHAERTGDVFRWRSHEISRIEGFSDAVFGIAVTLLVVSLEVPKTSGELLETLHGLPAFAATFTMLGSIWYAQYKWFRRYGLEDSTSVLLNLGLLFTAVTFMYPLKFFIGAILVDPSLQHTVHTTHGDVPAVLPQHRPLLFAMFGVALCAVSLLLLLMYLHAWTRREALQLDEVERFETRFAVQRWGATMAVGAVYLLIAATTTVSSRGWRIAASLLALAAFAAISIWLLRHSRTRKHFLAAHRAAAADGPARDGAV